MSLNPSLMTHHVTVSSSHKLENIGFSHSEIPAMMMTAQRKRPSCAGARSDDSRTSWETGTSDIDNAQPPDSRSSREGTRGSTRKRDPRARVNHATGVVSVGRRG